MADRTRLADAEEREALRRSSRAAEREPDSPVGEAAALRPYVAGFGGGRPGSSAVRAMNPGTLMAFQRLAGNRASLQAIGRAPRPLPVQTWKPREEEPLAEEAGSTGGDGGAAETVGRRGVAGGRRQHRG